MRYRYPLNTRSAVTALWAACFLLTYTFPLLNAALKASGTFWTCAIICLAGLLFIAASLPETKGKTLEEIESFLHKSAMGAE